MLPEALRWSSSLAQSSTGWAGGRTAGNLRFNRLPRGNVHPFSAGHLPLLPRRGCLPRRDKAMPLFMAPQKASGSSPSLLMPSFLHGSYRAVHQKSREEGLRYGERYRMTGSFSLPQELMEVCTGELVIAHEVVDFQRDRPAWRLYMTGNVADGLHEALDWQDSRQVGDAFEECCREAAWGALYFAIAHEPPMNAVRVALRLRAVLHFWEELQSARYLFSSPDTALSLEELMNASNGWALEAWASGGEGPLRTRLKAAAERMGQATREDCIEIILQQMPRALSHAQGLKHRRVLTDPGFLRQRLSALEEASLAPISAAWPAMLIRQLHMWDRQLEKQ